MARSDSREGGLVNWSSCGHVRMTDIAAVTYLLVQFDILHHLESQREITKQTVDTQQADDTEVAQQLV